MHKCRERMSLFPRSSDEKIRTIVRCGAADCAGAAADGSPRARRQMRLPTSVHHGAAYPTPDNLYLIYYL
eukprot:1196093-Prorocentrum_minimum.AAC.1